MRCSISALRIGMPALEAMKPIFAMAWELHRAGCAFTWHLSARSQDRAAFIEEILSSPFASRVMVRFDDKPITLPSVSEVLSQIPQGDHIYVCGPNGYMNFITSNAKKAGLAKDHIHLEHFDAEIDSSGEAFEVYCVKSDKTLSVESDQTILEAANLAGLDFPTAYKNGVCGTCITAVIEGQPDHRDMVLTDAEKAQGDRIAVCCSCSSSKRLVLKL